MTDRPAKPDFCWIGRLTIEDLDLLFIIYITYIVLYIFCFN